MVETDSKKDFYMETPVQRGAVKTLAKKALEKISGSIDIDHSTHDSAELLTEYIYFSAKRDGIDVSEKYVNHLLENNAGAISIGMELGFYAGVGRASTSP